MESLVVEIRDNSLDDGPGIRSVVFFKGCPLRCAWCQNPEAIGRERQLGVDTTKCLRCGRCVERCPRGAELARCLACGGCVEGCRPGARRLIGRRYDLDALVERVCRDEVFFQASGGGVTLSGGEPTLHPELAGALCQRLAERGISLLLETCGHFDWERFEQRFLPFLKAIYFDLKLADLEAHRHWTGVGNSRILDNFARLSAMVRGQGALSLLPRVPLIPDVTDSDENLRALATILERLGHEQVALLPYNPLWLPKAGAIGAALRYEMDRWTPEIEIDRCRSAFTLRGIDVVD